MGRKIMVVDDQEAVRYELSVFFHNMGHDVVEAHCGEEFIKKVEEYNKNSEHIDLVILDFHMPDYDGLTALEKVRSIPGGENLSVIMLTTETSKKAKDQGKKLGLKGWLVKPFDLEIMKKVFDQIIKN